MRISRESLHPELVKLLRLGNYSLTPTFWFNGPYRLGPRATLVTQGALTISIHLQTVLVVNRKDLIESREGSHLVGCQI